MTAGGQPPRGSIAETVQTTDGFLRHAGREFLVVLYTAVRSLKLYPIENAQVQKALDEVTATKVFELAQKLSDGGVTHIGVEPPLETDEDMEDEERQKEAAKRTYARSVAVTKEVINSIRMGRTANVKKVKRAVQAIVDQVINNESSLVGLTTLRDYDEYTFTHSVNVCIFSVALGCKLGLTKLQLYDLGMAALFHD